MSLWAGTSRRHLFQRRRSCVCFTQLREIRVISGASPIPSRPAGAEAVSMARLGIRTRKLTLLVHLLSAGAWIGIDVMVGVLVGVGWFADDPAQRGAAYQALGWFVVWPMLTAAL